MAKTYPSMLFSALSPSLAYGAALSSLTEYILYRAPKSTMKISTKLTLAWCVGLYSGGTWAYYLHRGTGSEVKVQIFSTSDTSLVINRTVTLAEGWGTQVACANGNYLFLSKNAPSGGYASIRRIDPLDGTVTTYTGSTAREKTVNALYATDTKIYMWCYDTDHFGEIVAIDIATMTQDAYVNLGSEHNFWPLAIAADATYMYYAKGSSNSIVRRPLADISTSIWETGTPSPSWIANALFLSGAYLYASNTAGAVRKTATATMVVDSIITSSDMKTYANNSVTDGTSVWSYGTPAIATQPISLAKCTFLADLTGFDWQESMYLSDESNAVWYMGI